VIVGSDDGGRIFGPRSCNCTSRPRDQTDIGLLKRIVNSSSGLATVGPSPPRIGEAPTAHPLQSKAAHALRGSVDPRQLWRAQHPFHGDETDMFADARYRCVRSNVRYAS
jgi:hypothetical protein